VRLNAAFLWQYLVNHRTGRDESAILDADDLVLLQRHSLATCKARIDPSDDWLSDPLSCHPDPAALLCKLGQKTGCLTAEKVAAARKMYDGARDTRTGARLTFPWLPGSEAGWSRYWSDPQRPTEPARVNFWRIWAFGDPQWNWWNFSFTRDLPATASRLSPIIDASDPDLSRFRARGGKLLQYHGLADPVVSPLDTLDYRSQVMRAMRVSPDRLAQWFRLFLIPGMRHCSGGPGFTKFDAQSAIEQWVEHGQAPDTLRTTSSRRPGDVRLVRPMDEHASW
jgi:feruloyl esterase